MFHLQRTQLSVFLRSAIFGVHKAIINKYFCISAVTLPSQSFLTLLFPQELCNVKDFGNWGRKK